MAILSFRAWDKEINRMDYSDQVGLEAFFACNDLAYDDVIFMQDIGIKDNNDKKFYEGDLGEFPNGDRFVIKQEEWAEFYVDWIGDPECEDQARDLYRISDALIIGNIYKNPELLNGG